MNQRGWVLQERFLAPRVLHFGHDQLVWECPEHAMSEEYQVGLPPMWCLNTYGGSLKANSASLQKDKISWYDMWDNVVRTYSKTSLTCPSDKLVALSGIAKAFRSVLDDDYVAGMWRKVLSHQLLWELSHWNIRARPFAYRAPSWSWASVDGFISISFDKVYDAVMIEVVDVHIEYATDDDTGTILSGWVDLKGILRPARLEWNAYPGHYESDWLVVLSDDNNHRQVKLNIQFDYLPVEKDVMLQGVATAQFFCVLATRPSGDHASVTRIGGCLVILLRLVDVKKRHFERVGTARISWEEDAQVLLEDLDEEVQRSLPCLRYEDGKHTIRVF